MRFSPGRVAFCPSGCVIPLRTILFHWIYDFFYCLTLLFPQWIHFLATFPLTKHILSLNVLIFSPHCAIFSVSSPCPLHAQSASVPPPSPRPRAAAGRCCPFKAARARAPRGEGAGFVGGGARRALHLQPRAGTEKRRRGARVCAVVAAVPAQRGWSTARGGQAHRHGPAGGRRRGDEDRLAAAAAGAARLGLGGGKWGGTSGRVGAAARRPAVLPPLPDSLGNFGCGSGAAAFCGFSRFSFSCDYY